ncbi:MAG: bifunctional class I SAM-dependent methyltransferase/HIT family protein, partial [Anaerolineales bacterium]|nr:bifunctional class I SAM-dependent methyltransferase/HIT family protein [Anaerolineales bacterium]MDW8446183.1 bifunctional class I SAM-dependent methyltransferase/HIT family protein [Anaerolineales bacterium]
MNLVYRSPQNPNSHLTVKERKEPSFPVRYLWRQGYLSGRILDFGCGLGADVAFLQSKNLEVFGYDPYYFPEPPQGKFDTILCLYVLNVLLPEEQAHVLMAVSELLKPIGRAYFSVRRDIRRDGFRTHLKHGVEVYQCNVKLPYRSIYCSESSEIYEYRYYNQLVHSNPHQCPFCSPEPERELLTESATAYALLDKYPVSPGHSLVIPKKHLSDYFELSTHTKTALWIMVERVKDILKERFYPDGFNVGFNVGEAAGQTIPHVHLHIIPRYQGDVENPRGGIRHVIPSKGFYT